MSAPSTDVLLSALRARVRDDPYRLLALAAAIGIAGGARLWRPLIGSAARIVVAAVLPSLIEAIQPEVQHGRIPRD
jgi:hypothetical protein